MVTESWGGRTPVARTSRSVRLPPEISVSPGIRVEEVRMASVAPHTEGRRVTRVTTAPLKTQEAPVTDEGLERREPSSVSLDLPNDSVPPVIEVWPKCGVRKPLALKVSAKF